MKKALDIIKNTFFYTTAIFTAVITVFMLVYFAQGSRELQLVHVSVFTASITFAAISGFCFAVVGAFKKLPPIFRYIINFILSYAAFFLWYNMLSSTGEKKPSGFFAMSTLYLVGFAVCAVIGAIFSKLYAGKKAKPEYENVFSDDKKDSKN